MQPNDGELYYNIGVALSRMKHFTRADWFLKTAGELSPEDIVISLYLIENKLQSGDGEGAERYLERLCQHHRIKEIIDFSEGLPENVLRISYTPDLLAPLVLDKIIKKTEEFKRIH